MPAITLPPGRYGRTLTARRRRLGVAALIALAVVAIVFAAWTGWHTGAAPIHWRDVGFEVHGPSATEITFEITMDPGATATCTVQALDENYAQVGVKTIPIPPSGNTTQTVTSQIVTQYEATTAIVMSCEATSIP